MVHATNKEGVLSYRVSPVAIQIAKRQREKLRSGTDAKVRHVLSRKMNAETKIQLT